MTTSEAYARSDGESGFRARTVIGLVALALAAASAFAALSAYAPQLRQSQDAGAHALSHSAVGYAGLAQLLRDLGKPSTVSRGLEKGKAVDLLILTPPTDAKEADIDALAARAGVVLIIAPKWRAAPDPLHLGWVNRLGLVPADRVEIAERREMVEAARTNGTFAPILKPRPGDSGLLNGQSYRFGPIDDFQTASKGEAEAVLRDQRGRPVLLKEILNRARPSAGSAPASGHIGGVQDSPPASTGSRQDEDRPEDGHVYILTDPDLLNNHGLANLQTAEAAVALIDRLSGATSSVTFDVTLNGFRRARSLLKTALEPPFLGATLCLFGAALLTGWRALADFGPRERRDRALALGKRALVDTSAGLIRMTRRTPRMGPPYAALIRHAALLAVGARDAEAQGGEARLDRLAERAGARPFTRLAAEAETCRNEADLMRAATALWDWKSEIAGER